MRRQDQDIAKRFKKSLPSTQQEQEAGKRVFYRLLLAQTESSAAALPHAGLLAFRNIRVRAL